MRPLQYSIHNQVFLHEDKVKVDLTKYESVTKFNLDGVFSEAHSTVHVYREGVQSLIDVSAVIMHLLLCYFISQFFFQQRTELFCWWYFNLLLLWTNCFW
jgi:hypothetical protein